MPASIASSWSASESGDHADRPDLADLEVAAGQQVRLQVGAGNPLLNRLAGGLRTYSIWAYDGGQLELRVFDHGAGPGAVWARIARVGDPIHLFKPQGDLV